MVQIITVICLLFLFLTVAFFMSTVIIEQFFILTVIPFHAYGHNLVIRYFDRNISFDYLKIEVHQVIF